MKIILKVCKPKSWFRQFLENLAEASCPNTDFSKYVEMRPILPNKQNKDDKKKSELTKMIHWTQTKNLIPMESIEIRKRKELLERLYYAELEKRCVEYNVPHY